MSLLSIIQAAMLRQGQAAPTSAIASQDTGVQQRIALLQDIGDELAERVTWQALNKPLSLTCDGATTLFTLPADWNGLSEGETFQSTKYPIMPVPGPVTNEQMAALKAFPVSPIQPVWRVIGGQIEFFPTPAAGEIFKTNYYTRSWVLHADATTSAAWTADTDVSLIDEKVLASGLEWRWLKSKGLDYAEEFRRYEQRLARADGRDDDGRVAQMSQKRVQSMTWPGVLPVYSWP